MPGARVLFDERLAVTGQVPCRSSARTAALAFAAVVPGVAAVRTKIVEIQFGRAAAHARTVVLVLVFANGAIEPHSELLLLTGWGAGCLA